MKERTQCSTISFVQNVLSRGQIQDKIYECKYQQNRRSGNDLRADTEGHGGFLVGVLFYNSVLVLASTF